MSRSRIKSAYLSEEEEASVIAVARLNGTSQNFVIRVAVRRFLGLPAARLDLPADETLPARSATSSD